MEIFELIKLIKKRFDILYADTKSNIIILLSYLEHKKLIDFDDFKKFFKEHGEVERESIYDELQEIDNGGENEQKD